jgi:hypothetical protein
LIRNIGYIVRLYHAPFSFTFSSFHLTLSTYHYEVNIANVRILLGVGPGTGAIAAVLFYKFIKILEYEMANPGQDEASAEDAAVAAQEVHRAKAAHMTV